MFTMKTDGTAYAVLHSFGGAGDGLIPNGELVEGSGGFLYGTTLEGGEGTVFKISTNGTAYSLLHVFSASGGDGQIPSTGVVLGQDGALYGTTSSGGSGNVGTVFKVSTNGTGYSILHNFSRAGNDGQFPYCRLLQVSGGALYGTTSSGGGYGDGPFKLNDDGTGHKVLYSFGGRSATDCLRNQSGYRMWRGAVGRDDTQRRQ